MRKLTVFFIIFCITFNINVLANNKENKEPNPVAKSAVLIDAETGRILWGKNENEPLAMASTTKIMTAILAIEEGNLNDTVVVSKNATKAPPVKMFLKEGEEIKLKELLYALMMQSSNDAAVAIAEHISGDVETFCNMMTEKAKQLGAKNTVFKTPNGLDSGDHHSTAYDMALIARYALKNKTFFEIINKREVSFKTNKSNDSIINKNRLVSEFNGANGIKTGYTGKAGHCFVGSATVDGLTLISVVLASGWGNKGKQQKWIDTKELLNYGFNNFKYETVLKKDSLKDTLKINKGYKEDVALYYENDVILPLTKEELSKIEIKNDIPNIFEAPVYVGQKIGTSKIMLDNEILAEVNILTKEETNRKTIFFNFNKIIKNWINIFN